MKVLSANIEQFPAGTVIKVTTTKGVQHVIKLTQLHPFFVVGVYIGHLQLTTVVSQSGQRKAVRLNDFCWSPDLRTVWARRDDVVMFPVSDIASPITIFDTESVEAS